MKSQKFLIDEKAEKLINQAISLTKILSIKE